MKFFNWMQNKLNGGQQNRKFGAVPVPAAYHEKQEPQKDKNKDWSHGLLTIGTLGNQDLPENSESQRLQNQENEILPEDQEGSSSPDLAEFTPEEVGQLQKELKKLLKRKPKPEAENADLPLDRFLNCPSSLEVDRTSSNRFSIHSDDKDHEEDIDRTIRVIIGRCKEVCMQNKKKSIGKKSISFLLKKMFVCRSGFAPTPSLRETLQESRMEKLLRTMLSKKIYPQNASGASWMKRYLEDKPNPRTEKDDDESQEKRGEGCKWVKTDSEYIVLDLD